MKYGFVLPLGDASAAAELAELAEDAGWDGFFMWEAVWGIDAWVALTAAAMRTERIRLGTMLTPLARRRPWDLAGQAATLDNLSGGRVILSVGLGAVHPGWTAFEPDEGRKVRAEKLDEGLAILAGLWSGEPFAYQGKHYQVSESPFFPPPPPVQRPRIPIWVVGQSRKPLSMRRAARWDGWLPYFPQPEGALNRPPAEELPTALDWLREERGSLDDYDVVWEGTTPADDPRAAAETVRPWADAGATWWIEADWNAMESDVLAYARQRLRAGPPRVTPLG
ncbi:MAG: LLM class flavin-dependent oxidoreductase [Micromonosporaceae bacterium]